MANTLITSSWVTKEVALEFTNEITFVKQLNRDYDDQFIVEGAHVGSTVQARLPQQFQVTSGQAFQQQNLSDQTTPVTLTDQLNVGMGWSSAQKTTDLDDIRERYINPAAAALANVVDANAFQAVYPNISQAIGTPGAGGPTATSTYLSGGVKLTDLAVPLNRRVAVLDQQQMATLANTQAALFNPSGYVSGVAEKGMFAGAQLGFSKWFQDANRPLHTTGTFTASTPVTTAGGQTGSSITTSGWASGATTLNRGDVLTFAGVYSVNPLSYVSTGRLRQFVVTATISDTTGAITLPIAPSIIPSGQRQNVSNSPGNGVAISVWGSAAVGGVLATAVSPVGLLFHPDVATFVMADLAEPNGGAKATFVRSKAWALSIRMVEQYQSTTDQNLTRLDVLVGTAVLQERLGVRVQG